MKNLTIYTDGACRGNPGPAAIGAILQDETGATIPEISRSIGRSTNNRAEYNALIVALDEALNLGAKNVDIRLDSELVQRQIQGKYRVKDANLRPLFQQAKQLLSKFESFSLTHIPREQNKAADILANRALDHF